MADLSNRLALPLLAMAQAQKEVTHNEALALLDIAVQPVVVEVGLNTPASAPAFGQCWILGPSPTGEWAGHAGSIAAWTSGGWRFVAPFEGMTAWSLADQAMARFEGASWLLGMLTGQSLRIDGVQIIGPRQEAIATPSGGTIIDVESRAAIASILFAIRSHGLIAS